MATAQTKETPLATTTFTILNGSVVNERFKVRHFAGEWNGEKCFYATDLIDNEEVMLKVFCSNDTRIEAHLQFFTECAGIKGIPNLVSRFTLLDHEVLAHHHKGVRFGRILDAGFFKITMHNTIRLGTRLLRILHAMHMKGFVHRDVKPLSVMCHIDDSGELQVGLSYFAHTERIDSPPTSNPSYQGPYQSLHVTRGGAYSRVDEYISVIILMMASQMVRPFDYNVNNHLSHSRKKEVFHENPYDSLTEDTMWLGDMYLMLEEMRTSNSFRHLEIVCAMSRALPGFDANTPITYHYDQHNGHLLID